MLGLALVLAFAFALERPFEVKFALLPFLKSCKTEDEGDKRQPASTETLGLTKLFDQLMLLDLVFALFGFGISLFRDRGCVFDLDDARAVVANKHAQV